MSCEELEQFYEAHLPKVYRFFFYKVLNREIAEDLTSKTFLKFVKGLRGDAPENAKAFLFGIARHTLYDYLREKYSHNEVPLDDEHESIEFDGFEPEKHILEYLERILPLLPDRQAKVLRLRFLEKLSLAEIAAKLKKDVNYVSTTQRRAFQSIKRLLKCTDAPTNITEET